MRNPVRSSTWRAAMCKKYEIKPTDLRLVCDSRIFKFKTTAEIAPLDEVIGQQRAVQAIEFGLNMNSPGYNIFVTGVSGTGKSTIVRDLVTQYAKALPSPIDWCLVNNFKDEFRPQALAVPAGKGIRISKEMTKAIDDLRKELPKAFKSESYLRRSARIRNKYADKQRELFQRIDKFAAEHGLQLEASEKEVDIIPVVDGKPITPEDFRNLPDDRRSTIEDHIRIVQAEIELNSQEGDKINQALHAEIEKLVDELTHSVVRGRLASLREEFKSVAKILAYLDTVEGDIVENVNLFISTEPGESAVEGVPPQPAAWNFHRYQVNALVDREGTSGAPVVFETNPTYHNVFGRIEKRAYMGTVTTDFTLVQAGSLLQANGGFLIMDIESVLMNSFVYEALKRALQTKYLQIEDIAEETGFGTVSLRPAPIPLEVKVILLGSYEVFEVLHNDDSKFNKIFKVRADFDLEVERTDETVQQYARFIARVCREESLLPFTPKGVAALVEYGEKYVADKNKLSLRFGPIQAILKEADYWARKHWARVVSEKYVIKAFNEYRFRHNLYEEKIHESYLDDTVMIDVAGEVVGQVNALAVYQIGEFSFGRPSRITAETYLGKQGLINIEREAKLSGNTHDKGVLILSGYLGRTFAQMYPLSLSISITFEQSYAGIDGDSASSTELYAIISSLADIPIRQGIAVTGSVNQKGQIQAIGDVNHKIEGFFEVCKSKGLTGKQGVIIPRPNLKNLMLKKEVIDAVKRRRFRIFAVSSVEQGIEILTGRPAGKADRQGNFPEGTVYAAVQEKLKTYFQRSLQFKKELGFESES
jgi:lon-related putative ATP-dependent protease